jgi:anaerobic ribonucleoside-triphosphate reductase activating protein
MINVLRVLHDTTVDGPGFRTSIYCAGCRHQCPGCHNPQSWAFGAGEDRTTDDLLQEILADPFADVTFTGGDPLYQAEGFTDLAARIKAESDKTIWCYTGFRYEDLLHNDAAQNLLKHIDVLVDGPFVQALRDEDLLFRGSSNQRIIDVQNSRKEGCTVLWKRED